MRETLREAVTTIPAPILTETVTVTIPAVTLNENSGVYIQMENILQNPELPTGCEIVALTSLLRFYGFDAEKTHMAKNYLPISDGNQRIVNGKEYRDSFFDYFIGDPFGNGYGCFSPAIVTAAEKYISDNGGGYEIVNISGCEPSVMYDLVAESTPVLCWATMDMVPSEYRRTWYDNATGERLDWRINEHALILCGFDKDKKTVIVNCSLEGIKEYDMSVFETRFGEMHSQAVYLVKSDNVQNPVPTTTEPIITTTPAITTTIPETTPPPITSTAPTTTAPIITTTPAPIATPKPVNMNITDKFPDPNFRTAIRGVLGISDDEPIMSNEVAAIQKLTVSYGDIDNLSGLEYFVSLTYLNCNGNNLRSLPELPKGLTYLACSYNNLSSLPDLPVGLTVLTVDSNELTRLPKLPNSLVVLWCDDNQLKHLPELPDSLTELACSINYLIELPKLPNSLKELYCSYNSDLDISKIVFKDGSTLLEREADGWFEVIDYQS